MIFLFKRGVGSLILLLFDLSGGAKTSNTLSNESRELNPLSCVECTQRCFFDIDEGMVDEVELVQDLEKFPDKCLKNCDLENQCLNKCRRYEDMGEVLYCLGYCCPREEEIHHLPEHLKAFDVHDCFENDVYSKEELSDDEVVHCMLIMDIEEKMPTTFQLVSKYYGGELLYDSSKYPLDVDVEEGLVDPSINVGFHDDGLDENGLPNGRMIILPMFTVLNSTLGDEQCPTGEETELQVEYNKLKKYEIDYYVSKMGMPFLDRLHNVTETRVLETLAEVLGGWILDYRPLGFSIIDNQWYIDEGNLIVWKPYTLPWERDPPPSSTESCDPEVGPGCWHYEGKGGDYRELTAYAMENQGTVEELMWTWDYSLHRDYRCNVQLNVNSPPTYPCLISDTPGRLNPGVRFDLSESPWTAFFATTKWWRSGGALHWTPRCSGSMISPYGIATRASCLYDSITGRYMDNVHWGFPGSDGHEGDYYLKFRRNGRWKGGRRFLPDEILYGEGRAPGIAVVEMDPYESHIPPNGYHRCDPPVFGFEYFTETASGSWPLRLILNIFGYTERNPYTDANQMCFDSPKEYPVAGPPCCYVPWVPGAPICFEPDCHRTDNDCGDALYGRAMDKQDAQAVFSFHGGVGGIPDSSPGLGPFDRNLRGNRALDDDWRDFADQLFPFGWYGRESFGGAGIYKKRTFGHRSLVAVALGHGFYWDASEVTVLIGKNYDLLAQFRQAYPVSSCSNFYN